MIKHTRNGALAAVLAGLLLAPMSLAQAPPPPAGGPPPPVGAPAPPPLTGGPPAPGDAPPPPKQGSDTAPAPGQFPVNYSLLADPLFDYAAIRRAQVYGLTARQIGEAAALADKAGAPLSEVISRVEGGSTFSALADRYGVSPETIAARTPTYVALVSSYLAAYGSTGVNAMGMAPPYAPAAPAALTPPPPDAGAPLRGRGRRRGRRMPRPGDVGRPVAPIDRPAPMPPGAGAPPPPAGP